MRFKYPTLAMCSDLTGPIWSYQHKDMATLVEGRLYPLLKILAALDVFDIQKHAFDGGDVAQEFGHVAGRGCAVVSPIRDKNSGHDAEPYGV
jgi:hypothetical protein